MRRDVNIAFVTGGKVNPEAGFALEIPCVYQFYEPKPYIDKLRVVIDSLKTSGLAYLQVVIVYVGVYICYRARDMLGSVIDIYKGEAVMSS